MFFFSPAVIEISLRPYTQLLVIFFFCYTHARPLYHHRVRNRYLKKKQKKKKQKQKKKKLRYRGYTTFLGKENAVRNRSSRAWDDLEDEEKEALLKEGNDKDGIFEEEYKRAPPPLVCGELDRMAISLYPFVKISRYN